MAHTVKWFCVLNLFLSVFWAGPVIADVPRPAQPAPAIATAQPTPPSPAAGTPPSATGNTVAQTATPTDTLVTLNPLSKPADLVIRNRKILTLRADIAGMGPQERARQMQERFAGAISDSVLEEPVVLDFPPYGNVIQLNDRTIAAIAYLDLDPIENKTLDQVVKETVAIFSQILSDIRDEQSLGTVLKAAAYSLLATAALVLFIGSLVFIRRFISRFLMKNVAATQGMLTRITKMNTDKFITIVRRVTLFFMVAFSIFLVFTWLAFVLKQFPYTRPWGEGVWTYVLGTCRSMGLVIVQALPDLFKIALIFLVARLAAKLSVLLFHAAESGRIQIPGVYPETARPTRRILVFIIYVFALVACYPYLPGSGSDAFKGISVMLGLMISLGGSGVINQAMSGLVLMYTRAHQVGDYVRIGETEGVVTALDMLATKIRTSKREEVTIPNSVVLTTSTKNYTRLADKDGVILHTTVTIGYSAPWRKIHEILIEAANRTAGLKKHPPAFVMQTALSDFYSEYQLNAYLEKPELRLATMAALHANIQDTFNEAGIAIVSPHYVADPPEPIPPRDDQPAVGQPDPTG